MMHDQWHRLSLLEAAYRRTSHRPIASAAGPAREIDKLRILSGYQRGGMGSGPHIMSYEHGSVVV